MSPTPFKKKQVSIRDINKEIAKEYKSEGEKYHKEESDWALTTADEHNEEWLNGVEHDKHVMLQELKKYFKPKFYDKVCELSSEKIRRLFRILGGR